MKLTARIKGQTLEIFNVQTGGIHRSHTLPPGEYSNIIAHGDNVSVTINRKYSTSSIRTINMKTGSVVSEYNI